MKPASLRLRRDDRRPAAALDQRPQLGGRCGHSSRRAVPAVRGRAYARSAAHIIALGAVAESRRRRTAAVERMGAAPRRRPRREHVVPHADAAPQPGHTDPAIIRNFCIIAHIDHGKSTLADRMLQLTGVVDERAARAQYLDRMDIERERGITIKSQAVRMPWTVAGRQRRGRRAGHLRAQHDRHPGPRRLHLRGLALAGGVRGRGAAGRRGAGHRGADAGQPLPRAGRRPAHHPGAQQDRPAVGASPRSTPRSWPASSAATPRRCCGSAPRPAPGVEALLNEIVAQTPPPVGDADAPPRALIFDSVYDTYRGVVTYVRVIDGKLTPPRPDQDDVDRRRARDARGRRDQPRAGQGRRTSASARSAT